MSRLLNVTDGGGICNTYPYMKMSHYARSVEMFLCSSIPIKPRKTAEFMSLSVSVWLGSVRATV